MYDEFERVVDERIDIGTSVSIGTGHHSEAQSLVLAVIQQPSQNVSVNEVNSPGAVIVMAPANGHRLLISGSRGSATRNRASANVISQWRLQATLLILTHLPP